VIFTGNEKMPAFQQQSAPAETEKCLPAVLKSGDFSDKVKM
jgi:hypothetical protein